MTFSQRQLRALSTLIEYPFGKIMTVKFVVLLQLLLQLCCLRLSSTFLMTKPYHQNTINNVVREYTMMMRMAVENSINPKDLRKLGKQLSEVSIESPSLNSRRITANIIIDSPMDVVWSILTDYNNLAKHVPNLVQSYLVPNSAGKLRLFQEGAQKIVGFDFRASLLMEMDEDRESTESAIKDWKLRFRLVESRMFDTFDGVWQLRSHSRIREFDPATNTYSYRYKTKLTYSVYVRPKGPVPVIALEWRIKEDIPLNLYAVKLASEKRTVPTTDGGEDAGGRRKSLTQPWGVDETLGSYIADTSSGSTMNNSQMSSAFTLNTFNKLKTYNPFRLS